MKPKSLYNLPARKPVMRRPEQRMQIAIFNFLRPLMALPQYREKFLAFHVGNGGGRSKAEAGIMQTMGVMAGVADIVMLFPPPHRVVKLLLDVALRHDLDGIARFIQNVWGETVFIELKAYKAPPPVRLKKDGTPVKARARSEKTETGLEDSQIEFRDRVTGLGFRYVLMIVKDERDAVAQVAQLMREYGVVV